MTEQDGFWNDQKAAQQTLQKIKSLEHWVGLYKIENSKFLNAQELVELAADEQDESLEAEIISEVEELIRFYKEKYFG